MTREERRVADVEGSFVASLIAIETISFLLLLPVEEWRAVLVIMTAGFVLAVIARSFIESGIGRGR